MIASTLPILCFLLTAWGVHNRLQQGYRDSLLRAAVIWGAFVVLLVETLGLLRALTPQNILAAWCMACIAAAFWARPRQVKLIPSSPEKPATPSDCFGYLLIVGLILLVLPVGLAALLSPPGPDDVRLYHMPRVLFWLQNRTVSHYPTTYLPQLYQPPWAEFAALNFYALAGDDRFVNLLTYACYLGLAVVTSALAKLYGAPLLIQVLAATFSITLPQAILSASGAKNDLTFAFWIAAAVYFSSRSARAFRLVDAVFLGLAAGLSIHTKATAYVSLPLPLLAPWLAHGKPKLRPVLRSFLAVALGCLLLNAGHYVRNSGTFGNPLGCKSADCQGSFKFTHGKFDPRSLASNVIRNLVLHATTPVPQVNKAVYQVGVATIRVIGADPQDPELVWEGQRFEAPHFRLHEALAGSPAHLLLILLVMPYLVAKRFREAKEAVLLAVAAMVSFILFSCLFRWQPWHTRLHTPFLVLMAPAVAHGTVLAIGALPAASIALFFIVQGVPFALFNELRPLASVGGNLFTVPRDQLYPGAAEARALASSVLNQGCRSVGLDVIGAQQIYPLLRALRLGTTDVRVEYLTTDRRFTSWFAGSSFKPCAVVYSHCDDPRRTAHCQQLGNPVSYGTFWLVTGFDADWTPDRGWRIAQRASGAMEASQLGKADVTTVPATLRRADPLHLRFLRGVTSDGWVTEKGFRVLAASGNSPTLKVLVRGAIPDWSGTLPQTLNVRCGEKTSHVIVLNTAGQFEATATVECPEAPVVELTVVPLKSFRPIDRGFNFDTRRLAFQLDEFIISQPGQ
jgi:hypothetical protein